MSARLASAVAVGCTLAVAAGCDSSGPSRQAFGKEANAICTKYMRRADAVPIPVAHVARHMARVLTILEQLNRALRTVAPPSQDRDRFQNYLAAQARVLRVDRQAQRELAAIEPRIYAALRTGKPTVHVAITPETIAHPTAAILEEMNSIPGLQRATEQMTAQMAAAARSTAADRKRMRRLAKELGLSACNQ
jgi:exoribonuclease R